MDPDLLEKLIGPPCDLDPHDNYRSFKKMLRDCPGPCIPFMAIYLTDLEFGSNYLPFLSVDTQEKDIINFQPMSFQYDVLRDILYHQKKPKYEFPVIPQFRSFVKNGLSVVPCDDLKLSDDSDEEIRKKQNQKSNLP